MPTQAEFDAFEEYYVEAKQRIDDRLDEIIETEEGFAGKRKILAHATQGGKRVRPVLTMLVADVYDVPYDRALDHAAIVELIHNACVTGDTRVRKSSGESVPIVEIEEGDEVLAYDEGQHTYTPRKVTHFHENGVQNVVCVEMGNRTVTCTPDHEFLVYRKDQQVRYAPTEEVMRMLSSTVTDIAARADTDAADGTVQNWLYQADKEWESTNYLTESDVEAVFDAADVDVAPADLCRSKQMKYETPDVGYEYVEASDLSDGDVVVAAKQTSVSGESHDSTFARLAGIIVGDGSVTDYRVDVHVPSTDPIREWVHDALAEQTDNSIDVRPDRLQVPDVSLARKYRDLGLAENHTEIRVPEWVWGADPETQRQFVAGVIDADGTAKKDGMIELGMANGPLVRDLKELLDQLGFTTTNIWSRTVDTGHIDGAPTTETRLYHFSIGPHKVMDGMVPLSPEYRERLSGFDRTRSMRLERTVLFPDGGPDYDAVGFTRVKSVEPVDEPQPTYDLCVEGDHNYIADGVVTHNSLVADDVYDGDATRRGAPALWKILEKLPFGRKGHKVTTGLTVMAENGLMALALELADDPDVVQAMGHGTRHLVDGFFAEGQNFTWGMLGGGYDKYIEINRMKTGGLFGMAAWMPATYVSVPPEQEDAARKYGEETGILYQVADDIADDDIPSFIKDENEELEKWYDNATAWVQDMPDHEKTSMMETVPAWMVYKMASQDSVLDEVDVSFIPDEAIA
jgi:geranylgeranyl pyrophosphate synthase/intein/homing endonuclease